MMKYYLRSISIFYFLFILWSDILISQDGYWAMRTDQKMLKYGEYKYSANLNKSLHFLLPYKYPKGTVLSWKSDPEKQENGILTIDFDRRGILIPLDNILLNKWSEIENKKIRYIVDNYIVKVEGHFENGKCTKGKVEYLNGNYYEGELNNWDFNGKGKLTYAKGTYREGIWNDGSFYSGVICDGNGEVLQRYTKDETYLLPYIKFNPFDNYVEDIDSYGRSFLKLPRYGEIRNENTQKLLLKAISNSDVKAVVEAISLGANPNYGEEYGAINKPLSKAIDFKCRLCVDELLPYIKNVGIGYYDYDKNVVNPLVSASADLDLLKLLFEKYKANPNAVVHFINSTFEYESSIDFYPVIFYINNDAAFKLFLEYGADPYIYSGNIPRYQHVALESTRPLITSLALLERKSKIDYLFSLKYNPVTQEEVLKDKFYTYFKPYQLELFDRGSIGLSVFQRLLDNGSAYNLGNISDWKERPNYVDPTENVLQYLFKMSPKICIQLLNLGTQCKEVNLNAPNEWLLERSLLKKNEIENTELVKELIKCKCD
ncbi:MAG: hypothetical protein WBP41_09045 [Saprospiraceae bacterium]